MCFLYFRVRKTASGWNVLNADANGHSLKLPEGDHPGCQREIVPPTRRSGQKSIGKEMDVLSDF